MFKKHVISASQKYDCNGMDYSQFTTVDESAYSSLMPWQCEQVAKFLTKHFQNPKLIIDANGHIGVDTIYMSHLYPDAKIISIELNKSTFSILQKNVREFKKEQYITCINGDSVVFLDILGKHSNKKEQTSIKLIQKQLPADFIFFDPPWGGKSYSANNKMMLYLSKIPIYQIINDNLGEITSTVVLKVPNNFDFNTFKKNAKFKYDVESISLNNKHYFSLVLCY
jgi:16S rRNA G966 N2-methylase RsmD